MIGLHPTFLTPAEAQPPCASEGLRCRVQTVFDELIAAVARGRATACCRLVETRGSTPQKAGAAMLVFADGTQAGTLGGGCVEAEVKRRALVILEVGRAEVATFSLDDDYGWDDGLICGGRMQIVIDPVRETAQLDYFRALAGQLARGEAAVEAIAFDAEKSGLTVPQAWLFDQQERLLASRGREGQAASDVPPAVSRHLPSPAKRPRPLAVGGVAYLAHLPRCPLVIVGGGHVGQAVANLAADLDFDVRVIDDRAEFVSPARFPHAVERIAGPIGPILANLAITPHTYCLIVTRGHNHDEEALYHLAERGAAYLGMIGSRRKIKLIFDDLLAEGIAPDALARVHAPVGIDIGSQTVPEIAVSILAELVAHRNLQGQVPGRPAQVAVEIP